MNRIAFVGLSTPVLYDYYYQSIRKEHPIRGQNPNPILESPFGLILFYDEIWFINESVCPYNMMNLPYVKFLNKEKYLDKDINLLSKISNAKDWDKKVPGFKEIEEKYKLFSENHSAEVKRAQQSFPINWASSLDNHSRNSDFNDISVTANSWNYRNLVIDIEIVKRLGEKNIYVELITNSFSQQWLENSIYKNSEISLLDLFIIDRIPNYLSKDGPYHEVVEDARNSQFLMDFREWIMKSSRDAPKNELNEIQRQAVSEMKTYRDKFFEKHLSSEELFYSNSRMFLNLGIDFLQISVLSQVSKVQEVIEQIKTNKEINKNRWQGFLLDLEKVKPRNS